MSSPLESEAGRDPRPAGSSSILFSRVLLIVCALLLCLSAIAGESAKFRFIHLHTMAWLAAFVLLLYMGYRERQVRNAYNQSSQREELFRIISENAADMIALVDVHGRRLYNSPAYTTILGYSPEELQSTSSFEQIHPDDRPKILEAAKEARETGKGRRLEYRIRHKDGTWRILESTASAIRNQQGHVEKLVIVNRDITERKHAEEKLAHNASHDALTDLPNRTYFLDQLQLLFDQGKRKPEYKFAVLLVDVDGFKILNDKMGQALGDQLIIQIGQRLKASVQRSSEKSQDGREQPKPISQGMVARWGGDEFTLLLGDMKDLTDARRLATRVQQDLTIPFTVNEQDVTVSASIGIALNTTPHDQPEELLRNADLALQHAKMQGKARCEVFDSEMRTSLVDRVRLEADLSEALKRQQFRLYFQPIVSLQTGRIHGFEALVRWQRPGFGLVGPADFIHVAEETGLILPIGQWVLRESCRRIKQWQIEYPSDPPLTISVNVSPRQFAQANLIYETNLALQESGLDPRSLRLEITETIAMSDSAKATQALSQLRGLNIGVSIDDFGTGYSSLEQLRRFPVDILKIDRSFVSGMDLDRGSFEVVRLIAMLAHNLNMKIIAEGVETERQVGHLKQLGIEFGQGYFFSKPVDREAAYELLRSNQAKPKAAAASV